MIIVEGPDGAGKTTLIKQLMAQYPSIPMHDRASSSGREGGPIPNLYEWAHADVHSWSDTPLSFYDRHPLISEYIYGPVIRGSVDPRFHGTSLRRHLARRALVIVCLPPLSVVSASLSDERDMPGVTTHIRTIWTLYASLRATWPVASSIVFYDWTHSKLGAADLSNVFAAIAHHRNTWEYKND